MIYQLIDENDSVPIHEDAATLLVGEGVIRECSHNGRRHYHLCEGFEVQDAYHVIACMAVTRVYH